MVNLRKLRNRMKQKGLAEEYAEKEYHRVNGDDAPCFTDAPCFNFDDIRYAFEAGYDSVFEGLHLLFRESQEGLVAPADFLGEGETYHVFKSASVEEPQYTFAFEYEKPTQWYDTLEEAMDAANDDYRERIKETLGL